MIRRLLYNELKANEQELASVFDRVYEESLKIWEEQHLYEYTTHGRLHTEQVERNLDSLTRPLQGSAWPLSAEEIFVLLSAACLHDIGMQRADDPDARRKHAQSAFEMIVNSHPSVSPEERRVTLPINDKNARVSIASVARGHWTEYAMQLAHEDFIVNNVRGRLKLLGLLLATADLLDLSPVRARFFRSIHRPYDLSSPVSQLHQTMHDLVKGIQILAPNPGVPSALQFRLEWFDDSDTVQTMNEWVMQWFHSQWRQLAPALFDESGGTIDWAKPKWATIIFNQPQGSVPTLTPAAHNVLAAERAEQVRINRDYFAERFHGAIKSGDASLFLFPNDSTFDWKTLSEWCEADARLIENCRVARANPQPRGPAQLLAGIISQLMEQWGEHIPGCNDEEALRRLESFVMGERAPSLVSIIRTDQPVGASLQALLQTLVRRPESAPARARVCLLVSPGAYGPEELRGATVVEFDGSSLAREEVERYLQSRRGFNPEESRAIYDKIRALELTGEPKPARVYTYIEDHCGF